MKRVTYTCDRCGKKIDGIAYVLTCYAEATDAVDLGDAPIDVLRQNFRQSAMRDEAERHLCKACKDAITDGVFIV